MTVGIIAKLRRGFEDEEGKVFTGLQPYKQTLLGGLGEGLQEVHTDSTCYYD